MPGSWCPNFPWRHQNLVRKIPVQRTAETAFQPPHGKSKQYQQLDTRCGGCGGCGGSGRRSARRYRDRERTQPAGGSGPTVPTDTVRRAIALMLAPTLDADLRRLLVEAEALGVGLRLAGVDIALTGRPPPSTLLNALRARRADLWNGLGGWCLDA